MEKTLPSGMPLMPEEERASVVHVAPSVDNIVDCLTQALDEAPDELVQELYKALVNYRRVYNRTWNSAPPALKTILWGITDWLDDVKQPDWHLCPGCGNAPGDGLTRGCNHESGCGFWRENR